MMRSACVYCGSSVGGKAAYGKRAEVLGQRLAKDNIAVVYGGGNVGLMGIVADAALAAGGEVVGVIPEQLVGWEVAHQGLTRLEIVASMHERKARMFDLSDGFIALPGGFGTLDEMFELLTLAQTHKLAKKITVVIYGSSYWKEIVNFGVDNRTDAAQSPAPSSLAPRRPAARGIPLTS